MPELPEVETIARGLAATIVGRSISAVRVTLPKIATAPPGTVFGKTLIGQTVTGVSRRGKYVVIHLTSGHALVTSLRMTGKLIVQAVQAMPPHPYTHVALDFSDGSRLCFSEMRQFGRMRLVGPGEPWDAALGLEPLSEAFTPNRFMGMLSGRPTPVKVFLLDQRRVAGIGNIYACEALWEARIRPDKPAKALTKPAIRRLHLALVDVLERAIVMRGTSVDDYVDAEGLRGGFQNKLSVYGREGEPCPRCGRKIVRTVLAQRGTWWCRHCQR
ncbi:MAG: bifunctional DNA-formamidopyrimidine glycosylase/DNA-(apurinic or apyrimidinic site) lyase, partial [Candidatus Eremiobacteraeota bacterium]|nr:bifunctional DNA-formamidopyrimidine glycosylase/DNA-(apurinic or apyrimidinic site) lyase [Candidatus Eremiobacteraeota bacterium]